MSARPRARPSTAALRRLGAVAAAVALAAVCAAPAGAAQATPSTKLRLSLEKVIGGAISPKSVVASPGGLVFAQNMMYRHTITVYDRRLRLLRTISDAVRLSSFGYGGHPGISRGAPVEAAFDPRGRYAWVSNYSMYGNGFGPEGTDVCSPSSGFDRSFVYRIDVRRLEIDRVTRVGAVPKYVAVSPDGRLVLVTNWCSYSLSVIDAKTAKVIRELPIGAYPRGIVVGPGSNFAYVAVMGSSDVARVDLSSFRIRWLRGIGSGPRHLVLSPDGRFLYVTLNGEGRIAKVDTRTGRVVGRVATGQAPRSMAISPDGRSLYVVNYESDTVSKVRASDLRVLQTVPTGRNPIGITYDGGTRRVWVACYTGSIMVFRER